jgi:hypothetical protein
MRGEARVGSRAGRASAALGIAFVLVLLLAGSAQASGTPPWCTGPTSLEVEVGDLAGGGFCSDDDGDALTIIITEQPLKGTLAVTSGPPYWSVVYHASMAGSDSFAFKANDGTSDSEERSVVTNNLPTVNDPPVCRWHPATLQVEVGDLFGLEVMYPCYDDEHDAMTITITQQPQRGTAYVMGQGGASPPPWVAYDAHSIGPDSFTFKASDGHAESNELTITTSNVDNVVPSPADSVAPGVELRGKRVQRLGKWIRLTVEATTEDLWASLSGTVSPGGTSKVYRLSAVTNRFIARGATTTFKIRVPKKAQTAVKRALGRDRKVKARLRLRVRDAAGNVASKRVTIKLTR